MVAVVHPYLGGVFLLFFRVRFSDISLVESSFSVILASLHKLHVAIKCHDCHDKRLSISCNFCIFFFASLSVSPFRDWKIVV